MSRPVHAAELAASRRQQRQGSHAAVELRAAQLRLRQMEQKAHATLTDSIRACGVQGFQLQAITAAAEVYGKARAERQVAEIKNGEPSPEEVATPSKQIGGGDE